MTFTKDIFEKRLYKEVTLYKNNNRSESSNFLAWFLINYFRIDEDYAFELVCDHKNDKGIDGIYVDEETEEIFILQSKFRNTFSQSEGDTDIRQFVGSGEWITLQNLELLDNSIASKELKSLIHRLNIFEYLSKGYRKILIYVTTGFFNRHAIEFIEVVKEFVDCWDCNKLYENFTYSSKEDLVNGCFTLKPVGKVIEYEYDSINTAFLFNLTAIDLLKLNGIVDRKLFAKNVRYGLGRTNVNKEITKTIRDKTLHKKFFLYHNGITIIAENVSYNHDKNDLIIENYSIVNGCQSTLTLYENRNYLTNELILMIKVIQTQENTYLADQITFYANNQNPINVTDLKSREKFQLDLQEKINNNYAGLLFYQISKGEIIPENVRIIDKVVVAQLLYSFKNEKPYDAHRKSRLFSQNYDEIFTRNVNEHIIYFLDTIFQLITNNIDLITEISVRNYIPTRFFILYIIKRIMNEDEIGKIFFLNPSVFLKKYAVKVELAFTKLIKIIIIYFNNRINSFKDDVNFIDYKTILINRTSSESLAQNIISDYKVILIHDTKNKLSELLK